VFASKKLKGKLRVRGTWGLRSLGFVKWLEGRKIPANIKG
jgi:hypothetical protein